MSEEVDFDGTIILMSLLGDSCNGHVVQIIACQGS